jgi:hypothetical protein
MADPEEANSAAPATGSKPHPLKSQNPEILFCPFTSGKEEKDLQGLRNLLTQMAEADKAGKKRSSTPEF